MYFTKIDENTNSLMGPWSSDKVARRLLTTNDDERTRPPLRFANVPRLSLTTVIAPVHPSVSAFFVGRTSLRPRSPNFLKTFSKGLVGISRTAIPSGIETTPKAREIPHSRPPTRVTWKAAPPTKTISTCTPTSVQKGVRSTPQKPQTDVPISVIPMK